MLIALFWWFVILFSIAMFIDCLKSDVKEKVFWLILILGTGPLGASIYAAKRPRLVGVTETVITSEDGRSTATITTQAPSSTTNQVIRGIGVALSAIFAVGGLLIVGFIVLLMIAFSSGGGSEGSGK